MTFKDIDTAGLGSIHLRPRPGTLVLWTEDNPGQSTDLAREATKDIPDARFEVLTDCAHWPQSERPDIFNQMHLEFLTEKAAA